MNILDPIQLNAEWRCYPAISTHPTDAPAYSDDSTWDVLVNLADWPRELVTRADVVLLHRRFDLEPIGDICLRFILRLDDAPDDTRVNLNGRYLGIFHGGQPFDVDVTDYLTLEDNVLCFEVRKVGPFTGVTLSRVPCAAG